MDIVCYTMFYRSDDNVVLIRRQPKSVNGWWKDVQMSGYVGYARTEPVLKATDNPIVEFRKRYLAYTKFPLPLTVNFRIEDAR